MILCRLEVMGVTREFIFNMLARFYTIAHVHVQKPMKQEYCIPIILLKYYYSSLILLIMTMSDKTNVETDGNRR
jgi:hypothetical protein